MIHKIILKFIGIAFTSAGSTCDHSAAELQKQSED
jgi:hypothetical protein